MAKKVGIVYFCSGFFKKNYGYGDKKAKIRERVR